MREAEEISRIAKPQIELLDKRARRFSRRFVRLLTLLGRPATGVSAPPDCFKGTRGQTNVFDELGRFGIVDPKSQRLANALSGLIDCSSIGVTTSDVRDVRDPRASVIPLEDNAVAARRNDGRSISV